MKPLRVLVACEMSGIVRDAFAARGCDAWSCDLLPTERPGQHIQGDALKVLKWGWDLLVAHPECTYLCNSGVRWLATEQGRRERMELARAFFLAMLDAPVPMVAVENPIPHRHARLPKYTQIVHPWQHGHGETKATCLWLRNLPPLKPTAIVDGREPRVHYESPGPERRKNRSRTYQGIAGAMAAQWTTPAAATEAA